MVGIAYSQINTIEGFKKNRANLRIDRRAAARAVRKKCRKANKGGGIGGWFKRASKCTFTQSAVKNGHDSDNKFRKLREEHIASRRALRQFRKDNREKYRQDCRKSKGSFVCGLKSWNKGRWSAPVVTREATKKKNYVPVKATQVKPAGISFSAN